MTDKYLLSIGENETIWHSSLSFRVKERANSKNKEYFEFGGRKFSIVNISGKSTLAKIAAFFDALGTSKQRRTIVFRNTPLSICFLSIRKPIRKKLQQKGLVVLSVNTLGITTAGGVSGTYNTEDVKKLGKVISTYVHESYIT